MYKKSKRKIVVLIMLVLTALWTATIAIIYFTTYRKTMLENREMMSLYATAYATNGMPHQNENLNDAHRLQVTTFYSVAFRGDEVEINNDRPSAYTDEQLVRLAKNILATGKTFASVNDTIYLVTGDSEYTLVTMMDNSAVGQTLKLLMRYTFVFGGIAVVILIGISILFANWIIRPLEESDRRQKQFISDAGHELKTPVSTISTNAELLSREIGDNKWLANIQYENDKMHHIVIQLLDLAKIEHVKAVRSEVNISRAVLAGVLPFEAKAYEQGIELVTDIPDDIKITADAQRIDMLVATLVDNAFSHCAKGSAIHIRLSSDKNGTILKIGNQGKEIPVADREKIFDRFYRSDAARNREEGHYGLGLAIAKGIVTEQGGSIHVECENGWVTFVVKL